MQIKLLNSDLTNIQDNILTNNVKISKIKSFFDTDNKLITLHINNFEIEKVN